MSLASPEQVCYDEIHFENRWSRINGKQCYLTFVFIDSLPKSVAIITGDKIEVTDDHFKLFLEKAGPDDDQYNMWRLEQVKGTIKYYECSELGVAVGYMRVLNDRKFKLPKSHKSFKLKEPHWYYDHLKRKKSNV